MKDRPDGDRLGEIVEIMLDAVCSTAPTIRTVSYTHLDVYKRQAERLR